MEVLEPMGRNYGGPCREARIVAIYHHVTSSEKVYLNRSSGRQSPASLESFDAHIRDLNDSRTGGHQSAHRGRILTSDVDT